MITSIFAAAIRLATGVRIQNPNLPKQGGQVFFARHRSHLDTLIIWAALPRELRQNLRPVAALDYWGKTRLRRWVSTKLLGAILIDRRSTCRDRAPLAPLTEVLEAGDSILIFPEGTRCPTKAEGTFKSGIFHLAKHNPDTVFIPVKLENLSRILPAGERLPLPLIARLSLGPAIHRQNAESKTSFLQRCESAVSHPQTQPIEPCIPNSK